MTDANSTAKVTQIVATQTKLVKQSEARSQTTNPTFKVGGFILVTSGSSAASGSS